MINKLKDRGKDRPNDSKSGKSFQKDESSASDDVEPQNEYLPVARDLSLPYIVSHVRRIPFWDAVVFAANSALGFYTDALFAMGLDSARILSIPNGNGPMSSVRAKLMRAAGSVGRRSGILWRVRKGFEIYYVCRGMRVHVEEKHLRYPYILYWHALKRLLKDDDGVVLSDFIADFITEVTNAALAIANPLNMLRSKRKWFDIISDNFAAVYNVLLVENYDIMLSAVNSSKFQFVIRNFALGTHVTVNGSDYAGKSYAGFCVTTSMLRSAIRRIAGGGADSVLGELLFVKFLPQLTNDKVAVSGSGEFSCVWDWAYQVNLYRAPRLEDATINVTIIFDTPVDISGLLLRIALEESRLPSYFPFPPFIPSVYLHTSEEDLDGIIADRVAVRAGYDHLMVHRDDPRLYHCSFRHSKVDPDDPMTRKKEDEEPQRFDPLGPPTPYWYVGTKFCGVTRRPELADCIAIEQLYQAHKDIRDCPSSAACPRPTLPQSRPTGKIKELTGRLWRAIVVGSSVLFVSSNFSQVDLLREAALRVCPAGRGKALCQSCADTAVIRNANKLGIFQNESWLPTQFVETESDWSVAITDGVIRVMMIVTSLKKRTRAATILGAESVVVSMASEVGKQGGVTLAREPAATFSLTGRRTAQANVGDFIAKDTTKVDDAAKLVARGAKLPPDQEKALRLAITLAVLTAEDTPIDEKHTCCAPVLRGSNPDLRVGDPGHRILNLRPVPITMLQKLGVKGFTINAQSIYLQHEIESDVMAAVELPPVNRGPVVAHLRYLEPATNKCKPYPSGAPPPAGSADEISLAKQILVSID
ncbi:uncharacterized protein SPPG_06054 [Spizellomyces punctatus DAOM BR117]|uniref:Uncharacterized protein n=1 Tax=Spizellomyces punctatus (strain DAOM BR117) TaxID=645134 RepID=A0A0L0HBM9_SPIPD|nr:uncharacterized protein SPPG_06054 [Spizellomyces punctatus DAOM BR117]KNC98346.1 hypothetical protein SPPG_06054 [Spizellomyces punctatus DAOM BR117]|eukprot:XP_016606386.1 hypothetical protein SPPG_06054 [Spizellomyces punctatus DAOM BR117]